MQIDARRGYIEVMRGQVDALIAHCHLQQPFSVEDLRMGVVRSE